MKELAGNEVDQEPLKGEITTLLAAPNNIYERYNDLRGTYLSYHAVRAKMTPSTDPKIPRIGARLPDTEVAKLSPPVKQIYDLYTRALQKYEATVKTGAPSPSLRGLIGETLLSHSAQAEVLNKIKDEATKAQMKLDDLQKARDARLAEASVPGRTVDEISQALKDAGAKTEEAKAYLQQIMSITSQDDLWDVQKKVIGLEAIRQELGDLLKASSDALNEKVPTDGDKVKIKLLGSVSAIRAGIDAATYPRVSDLLLESERLRIESQRLQGLIALEQERKTILDLKLAALLRELAALRHAHGRVSQARATKAIAEEVGTTAEQAVDALAYVAESWTGGRTPAEETDFLLAGIDHRAALENSSAAFSQWANLIGVPLSQLLAYHQSGIKSEDLANLISAAGLAAIAGGVY